MLTGTYTLEHATWDRLSNEDPEQIGVTQEQAQELCQMVDAEWERTVTETGKAYGFELEVSWVTAFTQAHKLSTDADMDRPQMSTIMHEIETAIYNDLEKATERATEAWSKRIAESELE